MRLVRTHSERCDHQANCDREHKHIFDDLLGTDLSLSPTSVRIVALVSVNGMIRHVERNKFRSAKPWWNSLTKDQRQQHLRHLSELTVNFDGLTTWSQKQVRTYFDDHREFLEAQESYLRAAHPDREPHFPKPDVDMPDEE